MYPRSPTVRPYTPSGPGRTGGLGCIRRCVRVAAPCVSSFSHGVSLSPKRPGRTGGTQVYPPLCGSGWALCVPRSRPVRQAAQAGPEGLGCIRRRVGVAGPCVSSFSHGASLSPKRARQDRGTRVYPPLCESGSPLCILVVPRGVPIPQAAQAGPEGLGCIRRCVGVAGPYAYLVLPRGIPIPKGARQNRRDSGVSAAVWEWLHLVHTSFSHGASLSPNRPRQDRGDQGVSAAVWEWLHPVHTLFSHGASLYPKRPRQDSGDSSVSAVVWE